MSRANNPEPQLSGLVSLVGAGPGDPELITMKGLRRLREAELVAYDRLVNPVLLRECHPRAELIYVGKHDPHRPSCPQERINDLLIESARAGKRVVRLKGGDPLVFGRGGEEALALSEAEVAFEIVPGISSALAVPAYAGIPVTHRGLASSMAIVPGHEDPGKEATSVDWQALATAVDTLVILMGVERLDSIVAELVRHGRDPSTPAAMIRWGHHRRPADRGGNGGNHRRRGRAGRFRGPGHPGNRRGGAATHPARLVRSRPAGQPRPRERSRGDVGLA